jgi:hypothetical protein
MLPCGKLPGHVMFRLGMVLTSAGSNENDQKSMQVT